MSSTKKLHVIFILRNFGFPHGLAPTQRVRIMARSLVEQGVSVYVLCMTALEKPPIIKNYICEGNIDGIQYVYTTGTTLRSSKFLIRRLIEIRGIINLCYRLIKMRKRNKSMIVYFGETIQKITVTRFLLLMFFKIINIKIVQEINELPWNNKTSKSLFEKLISPLLGLSGVIVISHYIESLIRGEVKNRSKIIPIMRVPILVDISEQVDHDKYSTVNNRIVFASAPQYGSTLNFIIEAMKIVWREFPDTKLFVTGNINQTSIDIINSKVNHKHKNIVFTGYLQRNKLLELYSGSALLLIPLFNDEKSKARFPTKIGEYLNSGRPIVTTKIGEIPYYFTDGINAFVSENDNAVCFGDKIIEGLSNFDLSNKVGLGGKKTGINNFDYKIYGEKLKLYFETLLSER